MRRAIAATALLLLATVPAASAEEIDYDSLNEATRDAIKTACHGWIFLDAANWIAEWFDAVSPLCDAEEQARLRALQRSPVPEPVRKAPPARDTVVTGSFRGVDPWAFVRVECENEYMCVKQRIRAIEAGRTVSMDEYNRIAASCEGEYWCIERVFDDLPDIRIPPLASAGKDAAAPLSSQETEDPTSPVSKDKAEDKIAAKTEEKATEGRATTPRHTATTTEQAPSTAAVEIGHPLPDDSAAPVAGVDTAALFTARATISVGTRDEIEVRATYTNHSPVTLGIGPVLFETTCRDGDGGLAWAGGTAWLAPGETMTLVGGAESIKGQGCLAGLLSARPAGRVLHLQKGISGYDEQNARCAPDKTVPLVIVMQGPEDGQNYLFLTGDGRRIAVDASRYDAEHVLRAICGGGSGPVLSAGPGGADYVATKGRYLSRDYRNFMDAWAAQCSNPDTDCAADYQSWATTSP